MKISCYLLLLIASFVINYRYKKVAIEDYTTMSKKYTNNCTKANLQTIISRTKDDKIFENDTNFEKISKEEWILIDKSYSECSKTFEFYDLRILNLK